MSVTLIKEDVKGTEILCQKTSQTIVENDIIVPDTKPDIKKILDVSATVCITQKNLQQDKAFVQGTIKTTVIYAPDSSDSIQSLVSVHEFNHAIDCRTDGDNVHLFADVTCENPDCTLLNSRKLNLRSTLTIGIKVSRPTILSICTDAEADEHIELKKHRLHLMDSSGHAECQIIFKEQPELPPGKPAIGEILRISATPVSEELCIMDKKALAKGQIKLCLLYSSDDDQSTLEFMEYMMPFTEILESDSLQEDMEGDIEYTVCDILGEVRDNSDGEARILGIELILGAVIHGNRTAEIEAVTDAYSLDKHLDIHTKAYQFEQLLSTNTAEISVKDRMQIPPMLPPLKQLCNLTADAKIDRVAAENGQITVYGTVHSSILYLSEDLNAPISSFSHNTSFSHVFDIPEADGSTACDVKVFTEHAGYTLSGDNSPELKFILGITVKAIKTGSSDIIEDISENSAEAHSLPTIILYFVQPGDTLWNIAKTYHSTVDHIKNLNNLESDTIYPGQKLKIIT